MQKPRILPRHRGTTWNRHRLYLPAFEDPVAWLVKEANLPENTDPLDPKIEDAGRAQPDDPDVLAGSDKARRFCHAGAALERASGSGERRDRPRWQSEKWALRRGRSVSCAGQFAGGLPIALVVAALGSAFVLSLYRRPGSAGTARSPAPSTRHRAAFRTSVQPRRARGRSASSRRRSKGAVRTALSVEPRDGVLCVFMPPVEALEDYLELLAAVEASAEAGGAARAYRRLSAAFRSAHQCHQGDARSRRHRGQYSSRREAGGPWSKRPRGLYEDARQVRLGADKFMTDGRHTGTGGGNHVVLGGATPADSPVLRRPDLLKSLVLYWQRHPSLSYLFSGLFIGPTSQAPRVDEARHDQLYELEIALASTSRAGGARRTAVARRSPVSATSSSMSPAIRIAPKSASTSSIRQTDRPGGSVWSNSGPSKCRRTRG